MALERRVTIVTSAIATLIYQDQTYLEHGISFDTLVSAASAQGTKYSKKQLEGIVNKEIASGSLIKLENGNLALCPADHDRDSSVIFKFKYSADFSNTKVTSSANSTCWSSSPQRMRGMSEERGGGSSSNGLSGSTSRNAGVRVSERRKVAKKVFDPSDYQMSRKPSDDNVPSELKIGRPEGSLNKRTIRRLRRKITKIAKKLDPSDNNVPSKQKKGRPAGSLNKSTIKKKLISAGRQKYELQLPKKGLESNISMTSETTSNSCDMLQSESGKLHLEKYEIN